MSGSPHRPRRAGPGPILPALALAALALATPWPRPAVAQPEPPSGPAQVDELLARCLEAYGGAGAVTHLRAFRQRGRITSAMRGHGTVERAFELPDRLRVESRFPGATGETRVLVGEEGWRNGDPVAGPAYLAMVLQAARMALPRLLLEGRERLADRGPVSRDDGSFRLLVLPLREGMSLEVEIEEATGLIRRSRGRAGGMVFETRYDDFHRAGGLLFAFLEETSIMGRPSGRTELEEVTVEDSLPPELFVP